jgi:DNA-binding response OmpR family regulator
MNDIPDLSTLSALVVEDHDESALLLEAILKRSGLRLLPARTAESAREVLSSVRPDIVLCDLVLPGEDGLGFVRWLRAHHGRQLPAVAMTAFYERYSTREVRDAGFDVLLHKPIDPEQLVHTVTLLVGR